MNESGEPPAGWDRPADDEPSRQPEPRHVPERMAEPRPHEPASGEPEPHEPEPSGHPGMERAHHKMSEYHLGYRLYGLARAGFIEYDRVLFFSDAVFAIAITLLAVNLHPHGHGVSAATELSRSRSSLVSFGISIAAIGLFWLGHHAIFRYIRALDRRLILLNLLFLGTIAFLPYPTEVLSRSSSGHWVAVVFYAACFAAAGLTESAIWFYAAYLKPGLADPETSDVRLQFMLRALRVPVVFLASIPIAFVSPQNAPFFWLLIPISGSVINRLTEARKKAAQP